MCAAIAGAFTASNALQADASRIACRPAIIFDTEFIVTPLVCRKASESIMASRKPEGSPPHQPDIRGFARPFLAPDDNIG
jgi:hypothetical protein